jgi:tRNA modification GTPase
MEDTIAAISTPPGENGIGIIRISGSLSIGIADKIFMPKGSIKPSECSSYRLMYGHVYDKKKLIDEALLSVMRKPRTYTCEDIVEINCHSGMSVLRQVLGLVLSSGARLALPGEFTKRAFLNGRIDLIQAEAVCDIIASRTKESLSIAQRQLNGEVSFKIKSARKDIINAASHLEADINFPEEALSAASIGLVKKYLKKTAGTLFGIADSADKGVVFREGACCVICGRPNVGKSSLMNSLLRHDRVIVAPMAGTTRDTIEEVINIRGIPLRIVDTAGIYDSMDDIARAGIDRSMMHIDKADLILLVFDRSQPFSNEDVFLLDKIKGKNVIAVLNKADLSAKLHIDDLKKYVNSSLIVSVSAKERTGLDRLEDAVYNMFFSGSMSVENILLSNSRHLDSVRKALAFLQSAIAGIDEKRPSELVLIDIKDAADTLGSITGELFTEDMLDMIFSRFCVGK